MVFWKTVIRLNSCSSFHHHHHYQQQHQHHHRRRRYHRHQCCCYGFKVINLAQKLFANKVISFSVDRKTNICLPIVLANMEYLKKCYTELFYNVCVTYYTDLLYFLLKGIIFNLIACSEDHNRIPVQLSTHAQVTEKHDGPKTVLKVSYSSKCFRRQLRRRIVSDSSNINTYFRFI